MLIRAGNIILFNPIDQKTLNIINVILALNLDGLTVAELKINLVSIIQRAFANEGITTNEWWLLEFNFLSLASHGSFITLDSEI